jgi:cytochrome c oxidase subunit 2
MASINRPSSDSGVSAPPVALIAIAAVVLLLGGILIGQFTPALFPQQASAEAQQIDNLFQIMLVIGGAIFLLVHGLLIYSIVKFRAKPGETADGANIHGSTMLEIIWTAIPLVIVIILTIISWNVYNSITAPRQNSTILATSAQRFNWQFTYSVPWNLFPDQVDVSILPPPIRDDINDDGMLTLVSPELHVFAGEQVELRMTSRDVIHAFWVPAFRLKQDVMPGRETTVRFTPVEVANEDYRNEFNAYNAERYPLVCTELCGAQHGAMVANTFVYRTQDDYNQWVVDQMRAVVYPPADPALRGRAILEANVYACNTCHVNSDLPGWNGNVGPSLNGVADRAAGARSTATSLSPAAYLYQALHEPGAYLVPGYNNLMPQLGIPECDTWAIVAYLATQSSSGEPAFEVEQPAECEVVAGSPPAEGEAPEGAGPPPGVTEATAEATTQVSAEATAAP